MSDPQHSPAMVFNVLSKIRQNTQDFLKRELERAGLTGLVASHGLILGCLFTRDRLSMRAIADLIGRQKSTLTVLADKLEQAGYIQREVSGEDSRVRELSLTAKGRASRENFSAINDRLQSGVWRGFSAEEQRRCMDFLARLEANSVALLPSAPSPVPPSGSDREQGPA